MYKKSLLTLIVFALSFTVGWQVLSWTGPTDPFPEGNVPAPINVSSTAQTKEGNLSAAIFYDTNDSSYYVNPSGATSAILSGNVGIGTTSPGQKLTVAGTIESTSGGFKFPDATTQTTAGACQVSGNNIVCSGIPDNTAGTFQITKNGVTCPIWKDCDGDGKTYGNGDCDESCATCYVGSSAYTEVPDGKDQNCDGVVDEYSHGTCGYIGFNADCTVHDATSGYGVVTQQTTGLTAEQCETWANSIHYSDCTVNAPKRGRYSSYACGGFNWDASGSWETGQGCYCCADQYR